VARLRCQRSSGSCELRLLPTYWGAHGATIFLQGVDVRVKACAWVCVCVSVSKRYVCVWACARVRVCVYVRNNIYHVCMWVCQRGMCVCVCLCACVYACVIISISNIQLIPGYHLIIDHCRSDSWSYLQGCVEEARTEMKKYVSCQNFEYVILCCAIFAVRCTFWFWQSTYHRWKSLGNAAITNFKFNSYHTGLQQEMTKQFEGT